MVTSSRAHSTHWEATRSSGSSTIRLLQPFVVIRHTLAFYRKRCLYTVSLLISYKPGGALGATVVQMQSKRFATRAVLFDLDGVLVGSTLGTRAGPRDRRPHSTLAWPPDRGRAGGIAARSECCPGARTITRARAIN